MNTVSHIERNFGAKVRHLPASDAVFYGALVFIAHLSLMFVDRWLTHQAISARIPTELSRGLAAEFALSTTVGLLIEVMLFLIGWLFITGMAVLLNGEANARPLFGWIGLCCSPLVLFSLFGIIRLWLGAESVDYSTISNARTMDELSDAIRNCLSSGLFRTLQIGRDAAYLLVAASMVEVTHRVCGVSRLKALVIVGAYVGFLFGLNWFGA